LILLLSGEGPTDIGACSMPVESCDGESFIAGPMAIFVDQLVESKIGYSLLATGGVRFISEHGLSLIAKSLVKRKSPRLPGRKKQKETGYFEKNARALAIKAQTLAAELKDEVISILFRDADGTASTVRGLYEDKRESMLRGFKMEEYPSGVPMIPKPKSEAWLLCALKLDPYSYCDALENESGNDSSPNSLKGKLDDAIGHHAGSSELAEMVRNRRIDVVRIGMPSMRDFRDRLFEVLGLQCGR